MKFEQIRKHQRGGYGSPCIFATDIEAERGLHWSVEIKPGMRAVRLRDGRVAIFRSASKLPGTFGYDSWHGGWEATHEEMQEVGRIEVPTCYW